MSFLERERTPRPIIEEANRLHLAGLSLPNAKRELETRGVEPRRIAIHDRVEKTALEPVSDATLRQIALGEAVTRVDDQRHWFFAAVDPKVNEHLRV